jgi:predicted CoA-binding protein
VAFAADPITELLKRARTIAVVGLSDSPLRPSHEVAAYLQSAGYRIIPVNPEIQEALGERAYPSLLDVPEKIDIVDIFRRPENVPPAVEQAIQVKAPCVWMQEGIVNEEAAEKARQAGMMVVMDRCILKEHRKRLG